MQWTVVGHTKQKEYFARPELSHAYLFHGPKGIGKRMFADNCAASLSEGPDRLVLEADVESARAMKKWAYARPMFGIRKVVIIDDVEQVSADAANTLLKVLEEPPAYLYFFLISSRPGQVLPTIVSRCQDVAFHPLNDSDMNTVLAGLKIPVDDKQLLAVVASGRPGEALRLVQEKKLPTVAKSIAGLELALKSGIAERIAYAKTIADDDDAPWIVSWWLSWTHAKLSVHPRLAPVAAGLLDLSDAMTDTKYNRRLALEKFFLEMPIDGNKKVM